MGDLWGNPIQAYKRERVWKIFAGPTLVGYVRGRGRAWECARPSSEGPGDWFKGFDTLHKAGRAIAEDYLHRQRRKDEAQGG